MPRMTSRMGRSVSTTSWGKTPGGYTRPKSTLKVPGGIGGMKTQPKTPKWTPPGVNYGPGGNTFGAWGTTWKPKPGTAAYDAQASHTGAAAPTSTEPAPQAGPPIDPIYDTEIAGLQRRRDETISGLRGQRAGTLMDYGYNAEFGDSSNPDAVTGLMFDPQNPFSRAALMLRTYQQNQSGNRVGMAARGQLYSGALQNQQEAGAFNYGASNNALQKALTAYLSGVTGRIAGAGTDYDIGASQAAGSRVARTVGG